MARGVKFELNGVEIEPGSRQTIDLRVTRLYTHTAITMPIQVVNGRHTGPRLFVSAAMHGDELNGVEIIRRLLRLPALKRLHGVLIAVPVVNVHGLIHHSRYLPDRRDLNRSFPGSREGSLTARLAWLFMEEIVKNSTHGVDLHTGALHRSNLPQIRAHLNDAETLRLAKSFQVPVLLNSELRDGSLRQVAAEQGIPLLLYEAGEALRFDEVAIRAGLRGIVGVMRALEMLPPSKTRHRTRIEPVIARSSSWVRAPISGILRVTIPLGAHVRRDDPLGTISDPFGEQETAVTAPTGGIVIGRTNLPLANEGDALFHIARFGKTREAAALVEEFNSETLDEVAPIVGEEPPIV